MKNKIQLDSKDYYILNKGKNNIPLFVRITYRYQMNSIIQLKPKKILEIGVGANVLSSQIKLHGYDLTTFDHDPSLKPDVVGDFVELPFKDEEFDVIACFEVLEHVPFEDSLLALKEMRRVSKKNVIFSVPYSGFYINISFSNFYCSLFKKFYNFLGWIPHEPRNLTIKIPFFFIKKPSCEFHYWEVGQKGFSKKVFNEQIEKCGFSIKKKFHNPFYPYHYYLILEKK